jgi:hypothetical protein
MVGAAPVPAPNLVSAERRLMYVSFHNAVHTLIVADILRIWIHIALFPSFDCISATSDLSPRFYLQVLNVPSSDRH